MTNKDPMDEIDNLLSDLEQNSPGGEETEGSKKNDDSDGAGADDQIALVQEHLTELDRTALLSLFADLSTYQGWQTANKGNTGSVGDLVLRKSVPFPDSIAVIYHDGPLSESDIKAYAERWETTDTARVTIITASQANTEARRWEDNTQVGIIGLRQIAAQAVLYNAQVLLDEYLATEQPADSGDEPSVDTSGPETVTDQTTVSTDDVPVVKTDNQFFTLELLGYEHYKSSQYETEGIIAAVEISSKAEDMTVSPSDFTLHSSDGYTYSGVDLGGMSGPDKQEFARELQDSLPNKWPEPMAVGWFSISGGGRMRGILYFPCDADTEIGKIRYKSEYLRQILEISDEEIESKYDIPNHASKDSHLGSWEEYSFELQFSEPQRKQYNVLPDEVKSVLRNL